VSGLLLLVLGGVALLVLGGVLVVRQFVPPAPSGSGAVAAERIDVTAPAVPIETVGSFGAGSTAGADPLTSSADGDRAVAAVLTDLQTYWSDQLSAADGPGLRSPAGGYISMDSTSSTGSALCISDPAFISGNAYYCPQGDGIVFDSAALVPVLLGSYGSAGLTAAFAHEFGHAVQAQIGPTPEDRRQDPDRYPAILIEAQADCDAGAFLAWVAAGNAERVHLPSSSLVRAVAPLLDFRDPATVLPADPTAHGLGLDRLTSVLRGYRDGGGTCQSMTTDDLSLTLGRDGVTTSPPSTLARYPSPGEALDAAATSVNDFAAGLGVRSPGVTAGSASTADLERASSLGQFAAGAAVASVAGQAITGNSAGAACFTGAWTASVFGHAGIDELGSWPTDADEALDLIRGRPGASFEQLAGFADGFHQGWAACG
jgi:predicted metalloprotease